MKFRRDPNRLTRKDLEARHLADQRTLGDLHARLVAYGEQLADAHRVIADRDKTIAEWQEWGAGAKTRLDAWGAHRCVPQPEPTVLDANRVDDPVCEAEIVEEQPAKLFEELGGNHLPKPRSHWMHSGMTAEIRLDDPMLRAALVEAEQRRSSALALVDSEPPESES